MRYLAENEDVDVSELVRNVSAFFFSPDINFIQR